MSELTRQVRRAGQRVRPTWSPERAEATVRAVQRRQRGRRSRAILAGSVSLVLGTAAMAAVVVSHARREEVAVAGVASSAATGGETAPIVVAKGPTTAPLDPVIAPAPVDPRAPSEAAVASASLVTPKRPTTRAPVAPEGASRGAAGWRDLARKGNYDAAYDQLGREGGPKDDVNDLLLAADVARLGHHPADAVAPLRQILGAHAADSRASLAAFTLGRVLLGSLADAHGAAEAFATSRSLSPSGPLAEDALAREVEARSRAGESDAARGLAGEYVARFPASPRIPSVRRFGGLE